MQIKCCLATPRLVLFSIKFKSCLQKSVCLLLAARHMIKASDEICTFHTRPLLIFHALIWKSRTSIKQPEELGQHRAEYAPIRADLSIGLAVILCIMYVSLN